MNKKVAILGSNGMLGQMVADVFTQAEDIDVQLFTRNDFDAAKADVIVLNHYLGDFDYIINCIGIINKYIDEDDPASVEQAIKVNSIFPRELQKLGTQTIQIATDCSGEPDTYGLSKRLGEVKGENFCNIRCSIIGPGNKDGLLDWFLNQKECQGYIHHLWNGVTTLAFAKMCLGLIKSGRDVAVYDQTNFIPSDFECKSNLIKHIGKYFDHQCVIDKVFNPDAIVDRRLPEYPYCKDLWEMAGYTEQPTIEYLIKELANYLEGKIWKGKKYL